MIKIFILLLLLIPTAHIFASSQQAFLDYRYQYEQFRIYDSTYRLALGEYKQYGSLASEQKTIDAAKNLLLQRNLAARLYFMLLNEKLTENPSMIDQIRQNYRTTLTNEIGFVENHSSQIRETNSLSELASLESTFKKHIPAMDLELRKLTVELQVGYLQFFAHKYDNLAKVAQQLIESQQFTQEKSVALSRWIIQVAQKRNDFTQKITFIHEILEKKSTTQSPEQLAITVQKEIAGARQLLIDGLGYLDEIGRELSYE